MDRFERIARVIAIGAGIVALSLTVVGPASPWGLLGAVPIAMGWSGW